MLKLPLVLGTALSVLLPVTAQAQSFDPIPEGECPRIVINYVCHDRMEQGNPILFSIPSGYDSRYAISAFKVGENNNVLFIVDLRADQVVAYAYMDDAANLIPSPTGMPSVNNPELLREVIDELVFMLRELVLY
jgi:hypothetical protein